MHDANIRQYVVVIIHAQQYAIWLSWKKVPAGWQLAGCRCRQKQSLEYIRKVWINLRPASVPEFSSGEGL